MSQPSCLPKQGVDETRAVLQLCHDMCAPSSAHERAGTRCAPSHAAAQIWRCVKDIYGLDESTVDAVKRSTSTMMLRRDNEGEGFVRAALLILSANCLIDRRWLMCINTYYDDRDEDNGRDPSVQHLHHHHYQPPPIARVPRPRQLLAMLLWMYDFPAHLRRYNKIDKRHGGQIDLYNANFRLDKFLDGNPFSLVDLSLLTLLANVPEGKMTEKTFFDLLVEFLKAYHVNVENLVRYNTTLAKEVLGITWGSVTAATTAEPKTRQYRHLHVKRARTSTIDDVKTWRSGHTP